MSTALVFPGHGSQRPGMGVPWRREACWSLVDEACEVLGQDVARLLLDADEQELREPAQAQLATFLGSLLVWESLHDLPDVTVLAGHSLGELTALVAGGALTCDDGLHVVTARAAAMQRAAAAAPGITAAVSGLPFSAVADVVDAVDGAWAVADDAPLEARVSGTPDALERVRPVLLDAGASSVEPLPFAGACGTPLMEPARQSFGLAVREVPIALPAVPVLSAVTVAPYGDDPAAVLSEQLTRPVRWREVVLRLPSYGVDRVVELGAGGTLADLVRKTLPELFVVSVAAPGDLALLH